ncbi:MAG: hypothetical protein ABFD50_11260 [Smithella sp.]
MKENFHHAAPVSADLPLISNQEVWINIALIKQYHENMPRVQAQNLVLDALRRLDIEHIAYLRNPSLTGEERFCAMLLRACMVRDALVMIDRPLKIIPHLKDIDFIFKILKKIDDLYATCYIYDYQWLAPKYGEI